MFAVEYSQRNIVWDWQKKEFRLLEPHFFWKVAQNSKIVIHTAVTWLYLFFVSAPSSSKRPHIDWQIDMNAQLKDLIDECDEAEVCKHVHLIADCRDLNLNNYLTE